MNPGKIGPIEYKLDVKSWELSSSSLQELQGVGNFHTGSIINANMFKLDIEKELLLTVKWQGNIEEVKLKL